MESFFEYFPSFFVFLFLFVSFTAFSSRTSLLVAAKLAHYEQRSQNVINKPQEDTQLSWMDLVYSSITSVFAKPGSLDDVFIQVGLSSDWGIMMPSYDERIYDKYDACVIPFYACTFSTMGIRLPLTVFKVDVLNHLAMTLAQVHPSC